MFWGSSKRHAEQMCKLMADQMSRDIERRNRDSIRDHLEEVERSILAARISSLNSMHSLKVAALEADNANLRDQLRVAQAQVKALQECIREERK